MDKNRRFAELAGLCWHELTWSTPPDHFGRVPCCKCGAKFMPNAAYNPNYADDPRLVLEVMRKRKDWNDFLFWLNRECSHNNSVLVDLILDRTGKLRDLAIEFVGIDKK